MKWENLLGPWSLGRVLGFPVKLCSSVACLLLLTGVVEIWRHGIAAAGSALISAGAVFGSVLLHELGHSIVARRCGVKVLDIKLSVLGGVARIDEIGREHEAAIAVAGPVVSVVLGIALTLVGRVLGYEAVEEIGLLNFLLAGFNMLPIFPSDGGRLLRAALATRMRFVRATDTAVIVSKVLCVGLGIVSVVHLMYGLGFIACVLWLSSSQERKSARLAHAEYLRMTRKIHFARRNPNIRWVR